MGSAENAHNSPARNHLSPTGGGGGGNLPDFNELAFARARSEGGYKQRDGRKNLEAKGEASVGKGGRAAGRPARSQSQMANYSRQ